MPNGSRRSALLFSSALAALTVLGFGGVAQAADQTYQFDIPAESLGQALTDFSRASSQQIVFSEEVTSGRSTKGLHGRYTATQALDALLGGSGLRVETNSSGVMMVQPKKARAASNEAAPVGSDIETVVVTGSNIHDPNVQSSPITTLDRSALQAQGIVTMQGALATLPSNFGGDINVETNNKQNGGVGNAGLSNRGASSSANIHGLGASATLSVLNGNHLPTGSEGISVDISMIPAIAIDRIDVLRDGASPIYGADAVGGVVNFVTRRDFDGAETTARYGQATQGGLNQVQLGQAYGTTFQDGSFFAAYQFDHDTSIRGQDRIATAGSQPGPITAYPANTQHSAYANLYYDLFPSTEVFLEGLYSNRNTSGVSYTGSQTVFSVGHAQNEQFVVNTGFNSNLGGDWQLKGLAQYASNGLNDSGEYTDHSQFNEFLYREIDYLGNLTANGTIFNLPAGPVKAALGVDYRNEGRAGESNASAGLFPYRLSRTVFAGFGEIAVPLIAPAQTVPLVQSFELTAAARYDNYSDFGGTTNPKVGFSWQVDDELRLRGNYSTSFRAPSFAELNRSEGYQLGLVLPDSASPSGTSTAIVLVGGSPNLHAEKARNLSFGVDYATERLFGFEAHIDYFNVDFKDRISQPDPGFAGFFGLQNAPVETINRTPSASYVQSLISSPQFFNFTGGSIDPASVVIYDNGLTNLSRNQVEGIDLNASIDPKFGESDLKLSFDATITDKYDVQLLPSNPSVNEAGTVYFPPKFKGRIGAMWTSGSLHANAFVNYVASYKDLQFAPPVVQVESYTTVDLVLLYNVGQELPSLSGLTVSLVANNLFDQNPPFIKANTSAGYPNYDPTNASIIGRTIAIQMQMEW
jgi:outer membrane receptor protein involved in Fe transport